MKLTFNFVKGTVINGEEVYDMPAWCDYTLEQVTMLLEGFEKGYGIRITDQNNLLIKRELIESVTVQL